MTTDDLELRAINTIRGLAMDMPQKANSGHQGTAMALAPLAHVLWTRIMRYDPQHPEWPDRDRFVLSAGHASVLLYSMLHLTGYDLSLQDLEEFRQWGSRTPGHPERGHTAGVEVTTGPLGQGVGNGVGLGVAEQYLRAHFGPEICDHHTFVICGDGDLSEGVSHESASLAGHLGLGRLVYIYDDNHITIDGPTELSLSDNAPERFRAYGWDVQDLGEAANDLDELEAAIRRAMAVTDKPSLIVVRSHIAYPSPKLTDSPAAHGKAFSDEEIAATKTVMGFPPDETFYIPDDVAEYYAAAGAKGAEHREAWEKRLDAFTGDRASLDAVLAGTGTEGWADALPTWEPGEKVATRVASGQCFAALTATVPGLIGGGADLSGNTGTLLKGQAQLTSVTPGGKQIYFGVREHGMGAVMNGMSAHGGIIPVGGTFFVFADYMRPPVRLAALSGLQVIYSWTHDSVGVGEDGPTHQPIEHLASLRAMPGLRVVRPADANETATAWRDAIEHQGPTALVLSRQDLPVIEGTAGNDGVSRGAYIVAELGPETDDDLPDIILIGTGSEVSVCLAAAQTLAGEEIAVRVVSMPCWEDFDEQDEEYQAYVLPAEALTLSVEAGVTFGWERWASDSVGIDRFGASAPGALVLANLGINPDHVAEQARALLAEIDD
ncbi:transketolase [Aquihabitans sp. McL0605]|uniref:transketolase n=1 Tax=Aquihabitans sp. McL0605 TaxID=3415671 RepID=UPI003CF74D18